MSALATRYLALIIKLTCPFLSLEEEPFWIKWASLQCQLFQLFLEDTLYSRFKLPTSNTKFYGNISVAAKQSIDNWSKLYSNSILHPVCRGPVPFCGVQSKRVILSFHWLADRFNSDTPSTTRVEKSFYTKRRQDVWNTVERSLFKLYCIYSTLNFT